MALGRSVRACDSFPLLANGPDPKDRTMDKDALTQWALKNGWQMIDGNPSLTKPSAPQQAIVRLILKGTVVNLEIKKPIGKWEKVLGVTYNRIEFDEEANMPRGLGLDTISGLSTLMQENKYRMVFAKPSTPKGNG
jgi:hypothetical protein